MNIVGLDLSLTATGIATEVGTEVLRTDLRGCERLERLEAKIMTRVGCFHAVGGWTADPYDGRLADLVVLEDYAYSRSNQAHQIGELHGVIRLALHEAGIPVALVAPTARAKYATGSGRAGKAEVLAAAIRRLGYGGHDDNEADALWLREMGLDRHAGEGRLPWVPESHRVALDKVDWPEIGAAAPPGGDR